MMNDGLKPADLFDAPVPGMSLVGEPQSVPWESPPELTRVDEIVEYYLPRLEDDKKLDNLFDLLESGLAVDTVVESLMSQGAMMGIHTVDAGMIAGTVIADVIESLADAEGIDYVSSADDMAKEDPSPRMVKRLLRGIEKIGEEGEMDERTEEAIEIADTKPKKSIALLVSTPAKEEEQLEMDFDDEEEEQQVEGDN